MKTTYKLWDDIEKTYFWDHEKDEPMFFDNDESAKKYKTEYLEAGNYTDKPDDCIQIIPHLQQKDKKTKRVTWVYGEKTTAFNVRVPASKYKEIYDLVYDRLKTYENPISVEVSVTRKAVTVEDLIGELHKTETNSEKPSTVSEMSIPIYSEDGYENELHEVYEKVETKADTIKRLQSEANAIKDGTTPVSGNYTLGKKKIDIEMEYDVIVVKRLPDVDALIPADVKAGICFRDRYDDANIVYVKWEGRYLKFNSTAEFERFRKDFLIK